MGKSEIDRLQPSQLHIGHDNTNNMFDLCEPNYRNEDKSAENPSRFSELSLLENQVAGHMNDGKNMGMMKFKGTVLKPVRKGVCGDRESCFYEELGVSCNSSLKELKKFVPQYFGKEIVSINGDDVDCLVLEDLTKGFMEPCIMDIKIGKRTWDPCASFDKIVREDEKYKETKRDLGFCVPGFQVYKVTNGKLRKYGKDYGKKLNKDTIVEAFKIFLNGDTAWSRCLLVQLLVNLWRIQNWAKKQSSVRLYSSSILLIYDARRLRQTLEINGTIKPTKPKVLKRANSLYRPLSLAVLHDKEAVKTGFSGQLNADGPIFPNTISTRGLDREVPKRSGNKNQVPTLKRMHSFHNNYDKDLQNIRDNYVYMLEDLVAEEEKNEVWASVKMIDFAHAYPAESHVVDHNYLDGIENVVKIFEGFLAECDNTVL